MEEQPKIDILMATYNGEKYLKEQLDSILNQTYKNIQLFINDDNSTDSTREILKEYEKKDNRIRIQFNENNLGITQNFENLLKRVESKYFMLADQDDCWNIDKIEKTFNKLIQENADLVFTDLEPVHENLQSIAPSLTKYMGTMKNIKKYNDYRLLFMRNSGVTGCTILTKKDFIPMCVPIPTEEPMVHDWWIALMISQKGKLVFLDEATIKYRQHGDNQQGIYGMKTKIETFDEYRKAYLELKLKQFRLYIKYGDRFENRDLIELSQKAICYYEDIKNKKYFNFKNYKIFFKLYNMEYFIMRLKTFAMLNSPFFGRILYKIVK